MPSALRRQRNTLDIWPGFVDALSALLIIIIFLLLVFTLAQFFLSEVLSGRDRALEQLNRQIAELANTLSLERTTNLNLREQVSALAAGLQASNIARKRLSSQLAELLPQKDALESMLEDTTRKRNSLQNKLVDAVTLSKKHADELEQALKTIDADKEKIKAQLGEIAQLNRDIHVLRGVRASLEKKTTKLATKLTARDEALAALRDRSKELQDKLSSSAERTALAQKEIKNKELSIRELGVQARRIGDDLTEEQQANAAARKQIQLLNQQLAAIRQKLVLLNTALEASQTKSKAQNIKIVSLGKRLNEALASKVAELAMYRSEFFGRLRKALGKRHEVRIVGDRFVFQSEVLFSSGSAELNVGGRNRITRLAQTLNEISNRIPGNLNWVLRVDGHTDRIPIQTVKFPSNWELSAARAISVVRELVADGIPANRLVAAGFGEFQPLDPRDDEIAHRRNRRIEFKLTQR
ncbi:MAG: peptidoglycan -binding protein [Pseudomonadota bacterium]|nr:peptidoglycan -binding protein [Pseudomonadota bacterium]